MYSNPNPYDDMLSGVDKYPKIQNAACVPIDNLKVEKKDCKPDTKPDRLFANQGENVLKLPLDTWLEITRTTSPTLDVRSVASKATMPTNVLVIPLHLP